jgi:hypothetical protein
MSLIDRYVYAVTMHLPEKQRLDIERELRTLIDDMLEQREDMGSYEEQLKSVLMELGDPSVLADSYRDKKRYLIGPQNFDNYILILKIVAGAIFTGISVASIVGAIFDSNLELIDILVNYLTTLFSALLQGFAWVTAGFAIAEYKGVNVSEATGEKKTWSLSDLPEPPQKAAVISRVETVISLIFITVFTCIIFFAPQLISAYIRVDAGKLDVIPVFNVAVLNSYKALIMAIFILEITKEAFKLVYGRWTFKLSLGMVVINTAALVLTLIIFTNSSVWNADFAVAVLNSLNIEAATASKWVNLQAVTVLVLLIAYLTEIVTGLYKGYKYGMNK